MSEAVVRVRRSDGLCVYFDADEQVVKIVFRCKTCGAWKDIEQHVPPCSPEQSAADVLERLTTNLYDLRRR